MAYSGLVAEIPIGQSGLTGSLSTGMDPSYLTFATNVTFENGTLEKEGGSAHYNLTAITAGPQILGGAEHLTNALAQRIVIACSDGTLRKDSGTLAFPTTLKSGLSTSMRPVFVQGGKEAAAGNRKLFVFTGTNVVQVLADDGATTTDIATPPTDWSGTNQPTFGFIHNYRLLAAGNANDPHRIYYSTTSNHEDFTSAGAGSLAIYAGEGDKLVGGISFGNYAIVWKYPRGIYLIDMRSATAANWTVQKISNQVGLCSPWAFAQAESDVYFMDAAGNVQSLRNSTSNVDVEGYEVGQLVHLNPLLRSTINPIYLPNVRAIYYPAKREVQFAMTAINGNSTVNNQRLIIDLFRPDKLRFRGSLQNVCVSLWLQRDADGVQRPACGDHIGFVWLLDQTMRTKDGGAYDAFAETVPTDLGFANPEWANRTKNAAFLEILFNPRGDSDPVTVEIDWDNRYHQTIVFTPDMGGTPLGSFVLGEHALGGVAYTSIRRRLYGGGKYVSFRFSNSAAGQNFSVDRVRLYFTLGNE